MTILFLPINCRLLLRGTTELLPILGSTFGDPTQSEPYALNATGSLPSEEKIYGPWDVRVRSPSDRESGSTFSRSS